MLKVFLFAAGGGFFLPAALSKEEKGREIPKIESLQMDTPSGFIFIIRIEGDWIVMEAEQPC